jgi:S-adenosylmethionine decarboxylase
MSGVSYMGRHVIADLHDVSAEVLGSIDFWKEILIDGAKKSGATVLSNHFHHFGEGYGITGVIVLAESHISIHTWPEKNYAAIDVFMCGTCDPEVAVDHITSKINTLVKKDLIYRK